MHFFFVRSTRTPTLEHQRPNDRYYDAFMPGIKSILGQTVTKENRPLQAKAIECLGLIAESVGPQRFGADATAAMNLIMSLQASDLPADDPRAPELMQCAVRICKCVGDQFVICLPRVLPPLLKCLDKTKIGMSVTDVEEDDSNTNAADKDAAAAGMSTWVIGIRGVGDKKISLNTAAIDDMHMSITILREYVVVVVFEGCHLANIHHHQPNTGTHKYSEESSFRT